jgi:hypothetical protein
MFPKKTKKKEKKEKVSFSLSLSLPLPLSPYLKTFGGRKPFVDL